jgi:hypothetical protein
VLTILLCVLYGSQNEQKSFPYSTTLTDCILLPRWRVFTARYALNLYITHIRFFFKGLIFLWFSITYLPKLQAIREASTKQRSMFLLLSHKCYDLLCHAHRLLYSPIFHYSLAFQCLHLDNIDLSTWFFFFRSENPVSQSAWEILPGLTSDCIYSTGKLPSYLR